MNLLFLYIGLVNRCYAPGSEEVSADYAEQRGCGVHAVPFLDEEFTCDVVFFFPLFDIGDKLVPVVFVRGESRL